MVASTCRTAVDGVATAFIAADKHNSQPNPDRKTSFLLFRQFKGYKNNNPGKQSQQCLPFSLVKKMSEHPVDQHRAIFLYFHQLMLLGFFFVMRSCKNFKVSGDQRTNPIRKRNKILDSAKVERGNLIFFHNT